LFDWIVGYINDSIKPTEKSHNFIGVLDIFGFELFKVLSFSFFFPIILILIIINFENFLFSPQKMDTIIKLKIGQQF